MSHPLQVIFLDNIDSFTYNLVDEFAKRGAQVDVFRNTVPASRVIDAVASPNGTRSRLLVVSPGPGNPAQAGNCLEVLHGTLGKAPILGVCLGHQALVEVLGGQVSRAPEPLHGKAVAITHDGSLPFTGLPNPMPVGRYHSLAASRLPRELVATAHVDGVIMAVRHRAVPALGVQFHPESVLTPEGGRLIENVMQWAINVG